ncbi:hypothetical protein [Xenorhabdus sp. KJ12.1]|nr:hypothetical protein [Xenorhabdus sp. KJ12.1]PHM69496.1 hypothetical protein Xekj_02464 [Xenorhabdus sp. KJ12.1]
MLLSLRRNAGFFIQREIRHLNMMPRKVLGGLTPMEVFTGVRVAFIT